MKSTIKILFLSVFIVLTAVSCKKEEANTPQAKIVKVEYHIYCESENADVHYLYPQNGKMEMIDSEQHKKFHVISFETTAKKYLSVEAVNQTPSRDNVSVTIFVDGKMLDEASSNNPSDKAIATGNI